MHSSGVLDLEGMFRQFDASVKFGGSILGEEIVLLSVVCRCSMDRRQGRNCLAQLASSYLARRESRSGCRRPHEFLENLYLVEGLSDDSHEFLFCSSFIGLGSAMRSDGSEIDIRICRLGCSFSVASSLPNSIAT